MKVKEKSVQQQIQFWGAIGPVISIFTLLVCLMKYSILQYGFPISLLIGIPLCWKWRLRGLAISLGVLLAIIAYHFLGLNTEDKLWFLGISFAAIVSLVITTLSFDEVTTLIDSVQIESKSRLEALLKLDEKLQESFRTYQEDIDDTKSRLQESDQQILQYKTRFQNTERLSHIAREELAMMHSKFETAQQELFELRHKHAQYENQIELLQADLVGKISEKTLQDKEEQIKILESLLECSEEEKSALLEREKELKPMQEEVLSLQNLIEEQKNQFQCLIDKKEEDLSLEKEKNQNLEQAYLEKELFYQKMIDEAKASSGLLENELSELRDQVKQLEKTINEKESLLKKSEKQSKSSKKDSGEFREIKGKYNQLKLQFEEKSNILDDTRRALFHMQEKLVNTQREFEEIKKSEKIEGEALLIEQLSKMEEERRKLDLEHQEEIDNLHEIIASLSAKA